MKGRLRLLVLLSGFGTLLGSWGFLVHRTVNQLAIYELPGSMQPFFYANKDYLVKNSVRPDLRRNEDSTEAPRHFIDLEMFGDSSAWKMPADWNLALGKFGKDSLLKYGYLPYHIIVMKERLTRAFRNKDKDSILFYAADLAHYIGDAHVPLHTTANYDGQLTGQPGMHALWETTIPELKINYYALSSPHRAQYLQNPVQSVWKAIREAFLLLPGMIEQEKALSESFADTAKYRVQTRRGREVKTYSAAFASAYSEKLGATINEQLVKSADLVADFWYTCWKDAGEPDLREWMQGFDKKRRKQCRREGRAFRHNQLLKNQWLMSRQANAADN